MHWSLYMGRPNQRLKLPGCGGRLKGNGSLLICGRPTPQLKRNPFGGVSMPIPKKERYALCG